MSDADEGPGANPSDEAALREWLEAHPPTVQPFTMTFRGFSEADANRIAAEAWSLAQEISRTADLSGLERITFAANYPEALAGLDRGFGATAPLEPTQESFGVGGAMAPLVMRDGQLKTEIFVAEETAYALISDNEEWQTFADHTLAHEMFHAEEHTVTDRALPGFLLSRLPDTIDGALYRYGCSAWPEYYASRRSAAFNPGQLTAFREMLTQALRHMDEMVGNERFAYRQGSATVNDVYDVTMRGIGHVVQIAGYLLGHADGIEAAISEDGDGLSEVLNEQGLGDWLECLAERLRAIWSARGAWTSAEELFTPNRSVEELARHRLVLLSYEQEVGLRFRIYFP